jgi:hypothetical protein
VEVAPRAGFEIDRKFLSTLEPRTATEPNTPSATPNSRNTIATLMRGGHNAFGSLGLGYLGLALLSLSAQRMPWTVLSPGGARGIQDVLHISTASVARSRQGHSLTR